MKIGQFFKSKRNLAIIAQGSVGIIAALFPEKFSGLAAILQSLFGVK